LVAFAGHGCKNLSVDGQEHIFASQPISLIAWAPVLPQRRVPGGAVLEIWVQGDADLTLPLPHDVQQGRLYFQGGQIDKFGDEVACECSGGTLRFTSRKDWPQSHLFFVAAHPSS
jgi:hypothetical protein